MKKTIALLMVAVMLLSLVACGSDNSATQDTNLYARSDAATYERVRQDIRKLLDVSPYPTKDVLQDLDEVFIQKNQEEFW